MHREQAPEPQGSGRCDRACPQHRGERADRAAHRGGRRRSLPARRRAPQNRGHEVARTRRGGRLRDGRLGRRPDRADSQRGEQPPQGADRGRARTRHPDHALAGRAHLRCSRQRGRSRGEGRVLRARHEAGSHRRCEPRLRCRGAHGRVRRRAHRGRRGCRPVQEEPLGARGGVPEGQIPRGAGLPAGGLGARGPHGRRGLLQDGALEVRARGGGRDALDVAQGDVPGQREGRGLLRHARAGVPLRPEVGGRRARGVRGAAVGVRGVVIGRRPRRFREGAARATRPWPSTGGGSDR